MRLLLLTFLVFLFNLSTFAQTDIVIGTGTAGNSASNYPAPFQDYYEGSRAQYLFTAAELTSAGMSAGNISYIKFEVTGLNTFSGSIEQYQVGVGTTTNGSLTTTTWETGTTPVFGPVNYVPVLGTNTLTFATPYFWNGTDNLVIEICNGDPGNATSVTYTDNVNVPWTTGLSFNGSHTYRSDNLGNLCGTTNVLSYGTPTSRPNLTFGWTVATTTGCYSPTSIIVSGATTTGASGSWSAPLSGTTPVQYNWEVRSSGAAGSGSTGLAASGNSTTNSATITGLASATNYTLYVRSDCGSSNTSVWSASQLFSTLCTPATIPYTENFESAVIPSLPVCMSKENAGLGNEWNIVTNPGFGFTTQAMKYAYNSTNAANAWFYTKALNLTAGTSYRLTFNYGNNDNTYVESLEVKYGTDALSTSMTDLIVDYPAINNAAISLSNTDFTPTTTGIYFIGFHVYSIPDQFDLYVDNISVTITPTCDVPANISSSNLSSTGVQLDWNTPAIGTPTAYSIYYSTNNTLPTGSTTPQVNVTVTTATITGLTPATKYYYYLRTTCGTSGNSTWTGIDSFTTKCVGVTNFSENFDAVVSPALPTCWARVGTGGDVYTQSTNFNSGPNTVYLSSSSTTSMGMLAMPPLSNAGASTHRLVFKARGQFSPNINLEVGYLTDPSDSSTFNLLQTIVVTTTSYLTYIVEPGNAPGTAEVLAFRNSGSPAYPVLIDDVIWEAIPSCLNPTSPVVSNISTTGAQIDWSPPTSGTPTGYQIYYSTSNTLPNASTTPSVTGITTTTATVAGLISATKYYFFIRSDCGTAGKSAWTDIDSFSTACSAGTVPYSIDFEGALGLPICTAVENAGTGNLWFVVNNPGNGFTTNALRYAFSSTSPADVWFYTRGLTLTAGTSYRLKFKYGNNSTTYVESMEVKYGSSPSASSMSDLVVDYSSITGATLSQSTTDFVPTTTGVYYLGFHAYSIADQWNLHLDDISIDLTPACNEPINLFVDPTLTTTTTAYLTWDPPTTGTPTGYDLYYTTSIVPPTSTTTPNISGLTLPFYPFTNLTPATTYFVYVRSVCGAAGASTWSLRDTINTSCVAVASFTQNFDGVTAPALPNCWAQVGQAGLLNTQATTASSSPNTLYIYSGAAFDIAMVSLPPVTSASTADHFLQFDARANFTAGGVIQFGYLTTPTDPSTFVFIDSIIASTTTYQPFTLLPGQIPGTGDVVFALRHSGSPARSVLIDNVQWAALVPVKLVSFNGERQEGINLLSWSTANEQSNKGFEVQRSIDGIHFETIGFVASKTFGGNSTSLLNYSYKDENPFTALTYYRLKQIDKDGRFKNSNVISIKGIRVNQISLEGIYPNPTASGLNIVMSSPVNEIVQLIITDLTGKILINQRRQLMVGDNKFTINVEPLASGTYIIKAICNNGCETSKMKFIKNSK